MMMSALTLYEGQLPVWSRAWEDEVPPRRVA